MSATVAASNGGAVSTTAVTSHTINLPASISAGDLLVVLLTVDNAPSAVTVTWPSGWTSLYAGSTSGAHAHARYRVADGSEGASITVTTSGAEFSAHLSLRITGHDSNLYHSFTDAGTNSTAPDPPSLTPAAGSDDYLWLAVSHQADGRRSASAYPSGYSNGQQQYWGDISGVGVAVAEKSATASSEDPGAYTLTSNSPWATATVAIGPAAAGPAEPTGVTAAIDGTDGDTTLDVSFTIVATGIAHEYRTTVDGGTPGSATSVGAVGTDTFEIAGLTGGTSVVVEVRANDSGSTSDWVAASAVTMAPARPTTTTASATSATTIEVSVSGGDVGGSGVDVLLWRRLTSDPDVEGSYSLVATLPASTVYPHEDAGLTASTSYTYKATCIDGSSNESGYGPTATETTDAMGEYTLTAESGSITLTGTAASLLAARVLNAEAGTLTLTGTDATLTVSATTWRWRLRDPSTGRVAYSLPLSRPNV